MLDRNKRKENYNFTQQFFCTTKEITPAQVRTRSSFRRSRFSMWKSVQKGKGPVSNRPAFHHAHNSLFNCSPRNVFELAAALRWIIKKKKKKNDCSTSEMVSEPPHPLTQFAVYPFTSCAAIQGGLHYRIDDSFAHIRFTTCVR